MPETSTVPVKTTDGTAAKLQRWQPFAFLDEFQEEMERFFRSPLLMPSTLLRPLRRWTPTGGAWAPYMDAYEKDSTIVVKVELPGLQKEDVQVEIDGGDLIIHGETKAESEVKEENYFRMERSVGSFYRRMPLPAGVTQDQIEATLKDGVLEVHIPKPVEAKPQPTKVEVK
jgi:HSP20 family protein